MVLTPESAGGVSCHGVDCSLYLWGAPWAHLDSDSPVSFLPAVAAMDGSGRIGPTTWPLRKRQSTVSSLLDHRAGQAQSPRARTQGSSPGKSMPAGLEEASGPVA